MRNSDILMRKANNTLEYYGDLFGNEITPG